MRRRTFPQAVEPAAPMIRLSMDEILDGPRPSDPDRDAVWLALRREIGAASVGTEYDLRRSMLLSAAAQRAWFQRRRRWVQTLFAGDRRVGC
jgi:hypothetical protein